VLEIDPADESADERGSSPLVLSGGTLALRRYWRHERRVAAQVRARCRAAEPGEAAEAGAAGDGVPELDVAQARAWLDRLFPAPDRIPAPASAAAPGSAVQRRARVKPRASSAQAELPFFEDLPPPGAPPAPPTPQRPPHDAPMREAPRPDGQKIACALALRGRLTIVTGGPGTGKTYTAARLLVLLHALHRAPGPLRVALAAPTGKAAARLRQSIEAALAGLRSQFAGDATIDGLPTAPPARTLHALLGTRPGTRRFRHDAANPLPLDLLFVDEASMVHLEMMDALLDALPPTARLVLLGDKDQLASVEAGAVMGDLCAGSAAEPHPYDAGTVRWLQALTGEMLPAPAIVEPSAASGRALAQQTATLRTSHRFAGDIGALARAVNRADTAAAVALLRQAADGDAAWLEARAPDVAVRLALEGRGHAHAHGDAHAHADADGHAEGHAGGYRAYLDELARRPEDPARFDAWARGVLRLFEQFRVLCAVREGPWGVAGLNAAIERALAARGWLPRRGEWYEGRPVMVTRNDPSLGVFNGDIGLVLRQAGAGAPLRAFFLDGEALRSVSVSRLADVETAFAMTVHKSQGSEFAHVALVLPEADSPVLTRELVYTGITRARQAFTLVAADLRGIETAIGRRTRRLGGLGALL